METLAVDSIDQQLADIVQREFRMPAGGSELLADLPLVSPENSLPLVLSVAEMPENVEAAARAERLIQKAGFTALSGTVENAQMFENSAGRYQSLVDAVHAAARGDKVARQVVKMNVKTDVIERTIKAGHVMEVELESDASGKIMQHGQLMDDVYVNALRFASGGKMRPRSVAEARNGARIEVLRRAGLLSEYNLVVYSRYTDRMSDDEAEKAGFFVDTKSCAIQVISDQGGKLKQSSAFVAGVKRRGEARHDVETVQKVAASLGQSFEGKDDAQIIDTPLLIHKSLMPNGVVDVVHWYDAAAGGTFFGADQPQRDYTAYQEVCRQREADLEPTVERIVAQLIAEAQSFHVPLDATRRLGKLSQREMINYTIFNAEGRFIDPRVFGEAAIDIEEARFFLETGNYERALRSTDKAQENATSYSCPSAEEGDNNAASESGDCDYISKECPKCKAKNVKTSDRSIGGNRRRISGSCGCSVIYTKS